MAIKKSDTASLVLRKRSEHRDTVSLQFEELCALLKGQYTSMEVTFPGGQRILQDGDLTRTLSDARPVQLRDGLGRGTGNDSNYYVARMGGK